MKKRTSVAVAIFSLCALGILVLYLWPSPAKTPQERHRTRVIIPSTQDERERISYLDDQIFSDDLDSIKAFLGEGEYAIAMLNYDFDKDSIEEQIVAFHSQHDIDSPVSITLLAYDKKTGAYRRLWSVPTAITVPGTVSLDIKDMVGDRSSSIVVTGMNRQNEHAMTIFQDSLQAVSQPFQKIAEIHMDGSITVQETERTLAYRQGVANGEPFAITAYGRDAQSGNLLDRIEITYTYNRIRGVYESGKVARIPGSQIEQQRLREILSGNASSFEPFIRGLWYHASPDGTIREEQYIYFDPTAREIIFYSDGTQQIFTWQNSNSTRYGIYVTSQNTSVRTLRRLMDISMESLDSLHVKVVDDIRLRVNISAPWDGLYRRAGISSHLPTREKTIRAFVNAAFDSPVGRFQFYDNGEYSLNTGNSVIKGQYAFFSAGGKYLLELRPSKEPTPWQQTPQSSNPEDRLIYQVTSASTAEGSDIPINDNIVLSRVRLGTTGVHDLGEPQIVLARVRQGSAEDQP